MFLFYLRQWQKKSAPVPEENWYFLQIWTLLNILVHIGLYFTLLTATLLFPIQNILIRKWVRLFLARLDPQRPPWLPVMPLIISANCRTIILIVGRYHRQNYSGNLSDTKYVVSASGLVGPVTSTHNSRLQTHYTNSPCKSRSVILESIHAQLIRTLAVTPDPSPVPRPCSCPLSLALLLSTYSYIHTALR